MHIIRSASYKEQGDTLCESPMSLEVQESDLALILWIKPLFQRMVAHEIREGGSGYFTISRDQLAELKSAKLSLGKHLVPLDIPYKRLTDISRLQVGERTSPLESAEALIGGWIDLKEQPSTIVLVREDADYRIYELSVPL